MGKEFSVQNKGDKSDCHPHGIFSRTDHMLGHKAIHSKIKNLNHIASFITTILWD